MKIKILIIGLVISIIVNIGLLYNFIIKGDVVKMKDQRIAIMLSEDNKAIVLKEMREFLETVQHINEGILDNNPNLIIQSAGGSGSCVKDEVPKSLIKSLPIAFKQMGFATHDAFDELANSVRVKFNPQKTQRQLNDILKRCVACHSAYQIKVKKNN